MRHVVLSGAIATGPRRMVHPTAAAGLVAPPGRALGGRAAPSVHSLVRSKSGRDHSGCRQEPELGSARTETAAPRATAHMDAIGNDWNTAPACVLSTVWGTASIRDLAVEVGAVPASPIRQLLTGRQAGCAGRNSPRAQACGFVDNAKRRCPQAHRPNSSRRQSE